MNPVRESIYACLAGDATLTALLSAPTAIFHRRADENAVPPYVIFHKQAGTPEWAMQGGHLDSDVWLVKGVDHAASVAETIAARIEVVLSDAPLAITGQDLLYLRRQSDVDYGEDDGDVTYQHVGGLYRLMREDA